ncbi:MAG: hypothetical protein E7265_02910 [Lachnospiraceae bacterium]|nr:hypothetical protein [Lachnospiraceae bacterium]
MVNKKNGQMKIIMRVASCVLTAAIAVSGLVMPQKTEAAKYKVSKITLASNTSGNKKTVVVAKGKKVKIKTTVKVKPNKKAGKKVTYTVKNKKIAKVSKKGYVTGLKAGKTAVVVTSAINKNKKQTINVVVKKSAVTKVKLPKAEESIYFGDKLTLAPTVNGKKTADKTIKYTSDNNKIVKVNSKGVITTVATGSAVVVAKAIDGSGKKASCKINVKDNISISRVFISNQKTVTFTLNQPYNGLNASNVIIKKKGYSSGAYRYTCGVESVTTTDNINYTVEIKDDDLFYEGDIVQVNIPESVGKTTSKAAVYVKSAATLTNDLFFKFNLSTDKSFDAKIENSGKGYSTLTMVSGTLPPGVEVTYKNGNAVFNGKPIKEGVYTSVFTGVDELGNNNTYNCTILVGSKTQIVACAAPVYALTGATTRSVLHICGGQGRYVVTATGNGFTPNVQSYDTDTYRIDYVEHKFDTPGMYSALINVCDTDNQQITTTTTLTYNIKQGLEVSGKLADANGAAIVSPLLTENNLMSVYFVNTNRGERHSSIITEATKNVGPDNKFTGEYKVTLPAGTYDIVATYRYGETEAVKYIFGVNIVAGMSGYDIKLPLYSVKLVSNNDSYGELSGDWYDANGKIYAYGSNLYLKAGTYNLESVWQGYSAKASFTVPVLNQPVTAQVVKTDSGN